MNPLTLLSATTLAEWIRTGRVTSAQVVEAHIAQVRKVNPVIRAMVETRFESARAEAAAADDAVAAGKTDLPPFHGVPCSIKESFGLTGMRNTGGLYSHRNVVATRDAVTVERLRAAGAIPLGTTNVSELCMWMESDNCVYGRTLNPYRQTRTVGGSSGGEGAIVACGAAPFGLGSDIGGSIRMPAFFNGVFGHKCTGGLVSNEGQFPLAHGAALRYMTTGPIARRAADLMPLLRVLAGSDSTEWPDALSDPLSVPVHRMEVLVVPGNGAVRVSADVRGALDAAAAALRRDGATVRKARFPRLVHSLEIWAARMHAAGGPTFRERMGDGVAVNPFLELLRWGIGRSTHTLPAIGLCLLESITDRVPGAVARFLEEGDRLREDLDRALSPETVILFPSYPTAAPVHGRAMVPPTYWMYTAVFNAMELPVTQVPVGRDRDALPLGVQVVGPRGRDCVPIAAALALERTCGGWSPPAIAL
jgi:fatty acid amide hydrolase 2